MRDDERRTEERKTGERETGERGTGERESYERPTLTPAGSFTNLTGLGGHGPKDTTLKHQLL